VHVELPEDRGDVVIDPLRLVSDQVEAYNDRDLDRVLSYYAEDAELVDTLGNLIVSGKPGIRNIFAEVFSKNPNLHAEVPTIVRVGDWVAIHTFVKDWAHRDGSRGRMDWVELYRVENGEIRRLQLFS
jgi:uncharacterized protein (TIGR02246 family)